MLPDLVPLLVDDGPRPKPVVLSVRSHEGIVAPRWNEAQLLAFPLRGARQTQLQGMAPNLGLVGRPERELEPGQNLRPEHVQKVALVLCRITRPEQARDSSHVLDACVVTGGHPRRTQPIGKANQLGDLHTAVAAHTRAGSLASQVALDEGFDHLALEQLAPIESIVRDAQHVGDAPRVVHVLGCATAALHRTVVGVVPQVQRDAHHVEAGLHEPRRGDGRIDASTHGYEHALRHA